MEEDTGDPGVKDEEKQLPIQSRNPEQEAPSACRSSLPSLLLMLAGACYLSLRAPLLSAYRQMPAKISSPLPTLNPASSMGKIGVSSLSSSVTLEAQKPPLTVASDKPLRLTAAHPKYGPMDEETRVLYGWDVVLEAQTDTLLTLQNGLPGATYEWRLRSMDGKVFFEDNTTTPTVTVQCPTAGMELELKVTEHPPPSTSGPPMPSRTFTAPSAVCKFVRREVRTLSGGDRDRYLNALATFYRTPLTDGKRRFGPDFVNAAWLTACHNSKIWCLHTADPFMFAHAAFVYWADEALRLIDPGIALPYWDHMIDAVELGPKWADSPIFQDDWFGAIKDSHRGIPRGRFANLRVAVGLDHVYDQFNARVDKFGHLNLDSVQNGADVVTRSDSVCGLRSPLPFAPPENLFSCYERHFQWTNANECMYKRVHNPMHSHVCGTWDCAYDLGQVYEEYAGIYSKELLAYIAVAGKQIWTGAVDEDDPEAGISLYRTCHLHHKPRCSCKLDVDHMPLLRLEKIMAPDLDIAMQAYPGKRYIRRGSNDRYVFLSDGRDLSPEDNERLMRIAAKIWCEGAKDGHLAGMMSTNDPLFYTSHAFYDRIFHFLMTSPELKQTLNMTWGEGTGGQSGCSGSLGEKPADKSPFPDFSRHPHRNNTLTMKELGEMLHPRNVSLPYVYDDIVHWGRQGWRPREHATWQQLVKRMEEKRARREKKLSKMKAEVDKADHGQMAPDNGSKGGTRGKKGGAVVQAKPQVGERFEAKTAEDRGGEMMGLAQQEAVDGSDESEEREWDEYDERAEKEEERHSSDSLQRTIGRRLQTVATIKPEGRRLASHAKRRRKTHRRTY